MAGAVEKRKNTLAKKAEAKSSAETPETMQQQPKTAKAAGKQKAATTTASAAASPAESTSGSPANPADKTASHGKPGAAPQAPTS